VTPVTRITRIGATLRGTIRLMADDSDEGTGQDSKAPDLELPKLFGRKRKKQDTEPVAVEPIDEPEPVEPADEDDATRRLPPVPPPVAATPVPPPPAPGPEPVPAPPPAPEPIPEPTPEPPPQPVPAPEPIPVPPPEPMPGTDPVRIAREAAAAEETTVLTDEPFLPVTEEDPEPAKPRRQRKPLTLPRVNPYLAAIVTGLVCGLVAVLLEQATQRGCESVRGVGSCGGIGVVALLVILAVAIAIGAVLLRGLGVSEPTGTSFLGVGVVAVLTLTFFLGSLESVWMFVVVPVLAGVAFAVSYWVTAALVEVPRDEDESTTVT
jgi:hypothetical protein